MNKSDPTNNWDSLFESVPIDADPCEEHQQQLKNQLKQQLGVPSDSAFGELTPSQVRLYHFGSMLMKYKIPHLATAAALLFAFSVTFLFGNGRALALDSVFDKIINAKFARWDMVVKVGETQSITRVSITPERTRHDEEDGSYMVFDWPSGKAMAFFPDDKTVMEIDTHTKGMGLQSFNMFTMLRDVLKTQLEIGVEGIESLGDQAFNGRLLTGFKVGTDDEIAIWVDPKTESAVRIEFLSPGEPAHVVLENYESHVEFEVGFFDLEPPTGYSDVEPLTEESFIEALRFSCKVSGGTFPSGLDVESTSEVSIEYLIEAFEAMDLTEPPTSEQMKQLLKGYGGFAFTDSLDTDERSIAYYAGANVRLGEKDRPIFWYKPAGNDVYRVIFADLEVRELTAPPKVEGAVPLSLSK